MASALVATPANIIIAEKQAMTARDSFVMTSHPFSDKPPQPPPAWLFRHFPDRVHFLNNRKQRYPLPEKASFYGRVVRSVVGVRGGAHEYRRQPPHCAVPTLDYRNAGRETVGTAATGVNR